MDDEVKVRALFHKLDRNKDGVLSFSEVRGMLKKMNPKFSERQLQKLFCAMDKDQTGTLDVNEFLDYLFKGKKAPPSVPRAPPQTVPAAAGVREEWKQATLAAHDQRRALHGAPPLAWRDECYLEAKKQADACQAKGKMFHGSLSGPSGRHGQNIFWCSAPGSSADFVTESWYNELYDPGYDFGEPGFSMGTGHFTQVIWKGTSHVGMAVSEDGLFVVANYWPAGNMQGAFEKHVLPLANGDKAAAPARKDVEAEAPVVAPSKVADAGGCRKVEASAVTPEVEEVLQGCPFPFKDKIEAAFKEGARSVVVSRESTGERSKMCVEIRTQRGTMQMRGAWGGG